MSLLTLLNPWCKNARWIIYLTAWMSLECYIWNWRKNKRNINLDIVSAQHGPDATGEVGAPQGRESRRWWDRSWLVRSYPAHPSLKIGLWTAYCYLGHWNHEREKSLLLFAYLGIMALLLYFNFCVQKEERETKWQALATMFLLTGTVHFACDGCLTITNL